jgi:hypothetical protein
MSPLDDLRDRLRELACDEQFELSRYWLNLHEDGRAEVAYMPASFQSWSQAHDGDAFDYDRALAALDRLCLAAATEAVRVGECTSCTIKVLEGVGGVGYGDRVVHQTTVCTEDR